MLSPPKVCDEAIIIYLPSETRALIPKSYLYFSILTFHFNLTINLTVKIYNYNRMVILQLLNPEAM